MKLGASDYYYDEFEFTYDNVLEGEGSNVTKLVVPNGVRFDNVRHPRIQGVTIVGENNQSTGLYLNNNYRAIVDDVVIYGFHHQMVVECPEGSVGTHKRQWFHRYNNLFLSDTEYGGQNSPDMHTGLTLSYTGSNKPAGTKFTSGWEFFNTVDITHSYIATSGVPLAIDGADNTSLYSVYLESDFSYALEMSDNSTRLSCFSCSTENRREDKAHIKLDNPKFNRFRSYGGGGMVWPETSFIINKELEPITSEHPDYKWLILSPVGYYQ